MKKTFEIIATQSESSARCGIIHTSHGPIETPAFAPVANQGTVKARPHNLVESAAAAGWIRGGLPSRELTRDQDYLERHTHQ